jgi:ubiquinone/menaquinone biosynthesis C-methylase UbiE
MSTLDTITASPSGLTELKRAHRGIWASGSYAAVAERLIEEVPPQHLLRRAAVEPGMTVLDVATGTGNVAIRAAQLGARVTGLDLTPELLDRARERVAGTELAIEWVEGDAEDLPFEDGSFDCVLSTFGVQFAPRHEVVARELVRVTRPGGTIGVVNWTPQGHLGRVLKTVGARMPKPPEYASPPPLWGNEEHLRELFGAQVEELKFERAINPFTGFASAAEWVDFMATNYGPLLKAKEKLSVGGEWDDLRRDLVALTAELDRGEGDGLHVQAEYLLALARTAER